MDQLNFCIQVARRLCFLFALTAIIFKANAQSYPVSGSLMWSPPYTPVLGELSLPSTSNNFKLTLILNDQVNQIATIKLRFKLEGSGIRLQTDQNYQPLPVTLTNQVPQTFSGADLHEYFRATSLQFQGMNRDAFIRSAGVPDGFYRVSFQAFSVDRGLPLSDEIFTNVFLASNEAPQTQFPECDKKITINAPQYIMFSWWNRAVNYSTTDFEFSLYWVQPKGRPPGEVVLTSIPIYTKTTQYPSLIYTSAEPALIPGEQYVWRIQAKDQSGLTLYKQTTKGFSNPCMFQWGDACNPPQNVHAELQSPQRVKITWDESPAVNQYTLEYRIKDAENAIWYSAQTPNTNYTLSSQLRPSTSYEFRIRNTCGINQSEYTPIDTFRTGELFQNRTLTCGERNGIPLPDSTQKLPTLRPGDKIQMGGFEMTVISASGSNGRFTGKLQIPVNFLNTKLEGDFTNLGVNKDYKVYDGIVNISSGSIALLPPAVQSRVNGYLETINILINTTGGAVNNTTTILNNGTQILGTIESIAGTVTGVDSTLTKEVEGFREQFREMIEGMRNGDTTNGDGFNNLWNKFVSVLNGGNGLQIGFDLKEIFTKQAKETRDSLNEDNERRIGRITIYQKVDQYNGFSILNSSSGEDANMDESLSYFIDEEEVQIEDLKRDAGFKPIMNTYEEEKEDIKKIIVIQKFASNLQWLLDHEDELNALVSKAIREVNKFDFAKVDFANLDRKTIEDEAKKYLFNQVLQW